MAGNKTASGVFPLEVSEANTTTKENAGEQAKADIFVCYRYTTGAQMLPEGIEPPLRSSMEVTAFYATGKVGKKLSRERTDAVWFRCKK